MSYTLLNRDEPDANNPFRPSRGPFLVGYDDPERPFGRINREQATDKKSGAFIAPSIFYFLA
jgi:hypothetical protein